jgi:hypothetical protein
MMGYGAFYNFNNRPLGFKNAPNPSYEIYPVKNKVSMKLVSISVTKQTKAVGKS